MPCIGFCTHQPCPAPMDCASVEMPVQMLDEPITTPQEAGDFAKAIAVWISTILLVCFLAWATATHWELIRFAFMELFK